MKKRMDPNRFTRGAACGLLMVIGSGCACAQQAPAFGAPVTVYAGTREYVWTLSVPVLTTERVPVVIQVLALHLRGQRWDYDLPTLKSQRFKLGQVADFSCKYSDWGLPETCLTQWRDVYADLPVLAMEHDHLDYDAAQWVWEDKTLHIDVPRWKWKEGTLTVSVPTFGPKDVTHAQASLDAQQAAATQALDQAIATLDTSIATVEAQGADPRRLATGQASVDLPALRQALRDEKARELEQLGAIRGELRELAAVVPDAPAAPTAVP
jgi:hypothetical protein